ncbi:MAG: YicC/YloC family endoribonuclease [Pseudomonadales bacterium]|jgi:uncharacterized protein (TIGR00255 family)|nr:YicC/YloC family endoribonuclease [Pseudomonadales bacterium]
MIRSMTGFARGERDTPFGRVVLELRSVNHRYLDLSLRVPEPLRPAEGVLRDTLRERLDRGKVDATLRLERGEGAGEGIVLDEDAVAAVAVALDRVRRRLGETAGTVDPLEVLRWPGVVREADPDRDRLAAELRALASSVADALVAHRAREGARLAELVETRLAGIEAIVGELAAESTGFVAALRERLRQRARELAAELDPPRLEQEVALLAQKADVAEELDRLRAHVGEIRLTLAGDGPAGRRLDFLAQELNREANTLASKAGDAGVAHRAVDLKVLIEQIREQIQNVE